MIKKPTKRQEYENSQLSLKYAKDKIRKRETLKIEHLVSGNMLFFSYKPQDDESPYDKNPLILIIKATSKHVLGINFHWCPIPMRKKLIKLFLQKNKHNITRGQPLTLDKTMTKEFYRLCKPIFRKYIIKRMSRRIAVIPPEEMGHVVYLRAEKFIGISAENAWKLAILKLKGKKKI